MGRKYNFHLVERRKTPLEPLKLFNIISSLVLVGALLCLLSLKWDIHNIFSCSRPKVQVWPLSPLMRTLSTGANGCALNHMHAILVVIFKCQHGKCFAEC